MPGETAQHTIHINGELVTLRLDSVISVSVLISVSLVCLRPESESSSESRSRSRSPGPEKITFITSFGGSDDEAAAAAAAAAATQTSAPHSGHTASTLQHSAGHSRGSRSVTFHLFGFSTSCFILVTLMSVADRKNTDEFWVLWSERWPTFHNLCGAEDFTLLNKRNVSKD